MWAISSVGRAPPLQGGGHWFETGIAHQYLLLSLSIHSFFIAYLFIVITLIR